ncbi:peroxiredoxin [Legionella taurinensis]|uniref:thioredoxin-dependent peroxiredoxin n=1 Tax=Legionella taurinensis TaxID=70611 RepID=A0A3A5M1G4_9GAMM|nr:peroxiredoxin [Legionella taurinensis]MDX1835978.1 peroxiredoxin [Legionella taurinensis]PUT38691.1 peroxiredoxin [Legionella taurinensis]PUT40070.1 peroxiredoxin [Legionella taurinensis]PUT42222.1 peroxiredoxin [Legionella taurinensis]PUT45994.1 peroxiredoxin [Legionella taurinensis]
MNIGEKLPAFSFTATNGLSASLNDYQGQWVVLYFYPKDSTPGCTVEGQNFRDAYPAFQALNTEIFGISRDSLKSHDSFKCNQQFPFELISDKDEEICQLFDVIKMKSLYGKEVRGIERSTFLIDPQGILRHEWRKVSVPGHVDDVLATLKSLQQ